MSKSKKRTLAELESNPFPPTKRARTQHATTLPPAPKTAIQTPSSPTLIASVPTSPPSQSPQSSAIDATDSATSSPTSTTSSSETSTSNGTSSDSEAESARNRITLLPPIPDSTSTSSTATTSSFPTSTSASITDEVSSELVATMHNRSITALFTANSTSTSSTETTSSLPTSTSVSMTDDVSGSSSSASNSQTSSKSSSGQDSASPSPEMRGTLTAKNLAMLQRRLDLLLPKIQSANDLLEVERREGRLGERDIENVTDEDADGGEKGYIAMDLGLGVLEERQMKRGVYKMGTTSGSSSESDESSGQWDVIRDGKGNIIAKLMQAKESGGKRAVKIEEVGSG